MVSTKPRVRREVHQRAKGPIDPRLGERIRQLRVARGMTQADLAGADFSKGFISLLETGRTRASLRAADVLAHRLGTSAAELVATGQRNSSELELLLLRGEQQLSAGRAREAIDFLERAVAQGTGLVRARALRGRGRALVEAGQPRDGLASLEEAGHAFEALNNRELQIRTMYDRALAHARLNEPGNALALALECESAMRASAVVDRTLELQLRSLLAAIFSRAGDTESADLQARQALALAEDVVDTEALGTLYSTLSITRQRQQDLDGALTYARKSLGLFETLGREQAVGQMWHNVASIYLQRGDLAKAEDALTRAEQVARAAKIGSLEARLLSLRAEVAVARRRWNDAETFAAAALGHPSASAHTRGHAFLARARVLSSKKSTAAKVRAVLDQAITALKDEPPRVRAEAHRAYAELLAARGEWRGAYEESRKALELSGMHFR
jgi:transcriptional regulator with XRE-family HTH domain